MQSLIKKRKKKRNPKDQQHKHYLSWSMCDITPSQFWAITALVAVSCAVLLVIIALALAGSRAMKERNSYLNKRNYILMM
jgi:hypothetical protein